MKTEFSEFSYGSALSYEIMNAFLPDVVAMPLLPSSVAAGSADFDVHLVPDGWPIFLQFKLAEYMMTGRANYWSHYEAPFFRIAIRSRRHSNQHNLLRALSAAEPEVYYVAPEFYRQTEFNLAFGSNRILRESTFFSLRVLPDLTDDVQHHITYRKDVPGFHWHSETAKALGTRASGRDWVNHLQRLTHEPRELGEGFFIDLRAQLVELVREHTLQPSLFPDELPVSLDDASSLAVFRDLRYLLVTCFGLETMILRPQK
jgi:hypothetical protein